MLFQWRCFESQENARALLTECEVNMDGNRPTAFSLLALDREANKVHNHAKEKEGNIQPC